DNVKEMYLKQSKMASTNFLKKAISLANTCDLAYKNSQNQRLLVELCLLEIASLTATEEKKNEVERVILAPDAITRGPESPILSAAKETTVPKTELPKEKSTEASQPAQEPPAQTQEEKRKGPEEPERGAAVPCKNKPGSEQGETGKEKTVKQEIQGVEETVEKDTNSAATATPTITAKEPTATMEPTEEKPRQRIV